MMERDCSALLVFGGKLLFVTKICKKCDGCRPNEQWSKRDADLIYFSPVSFGSNSIVSCNHTARVFDTSLELWSLNSIQI